MVIPVEDAILQANVVLFDLTWITTNVIFSLTMSIISLVPRPRHIFKTEIVVSTVLNRSEQFYFFGSKLNCF
jgi:hypothetical protein